MKSPTPHDPLDDQIAAALHGELTPEERTQFDSRLAHDPAAQAAYQEAQLMHDLLEKTHQSAQPDSAFEQRMVSGIRRKLQTDKHRESSLESLLVLWAWLRRFPKLFRLRLFEGAIVLGIIAVLAGVALGPITKGTKQAKRSAEMQRRQQALAQDSNMDQIEASHKPALLAMESDSGLRSDNLKIHDVADSAPLNGVNAYTGGVTLSAGKTIVSTTTPQGETVRSSGFSVPTVQAQAPAVASTPPASIDTTSPPFNLASVDLKWNENSKSPPVPLADKSINAAPSVTTQNGRQQTLEEVRVFPYPASTTNTPIADARKLIRNAQLDLEVKSFQMASDQITALTKEAGGYVDTSNSQKGGNGKLQGSVVVKVLPQNLDGFLLKLRDLGQVQNQSVSTDDVTKDYYDTQARLDNSQRMETQLQDLLKHANSKVSDLLQVERELGRVRGEIEQMQGQLKLYDFQVQYATVTMNLSEKDLNQTAAYLLKEQDDFSLFATDVEGTFQKARQAADSFKAQVLTANLNHNSGSDVSAEIVVMVAPDQIEPFLGQVRALGRVANFTRQTQRVAKDGGDSDQPADQALTEKDKVQVHLAIRSDDDSRKQVALTVVTKAVDEALDQAKTTALAHAGVEILSSSLNKTPEGQSTAQLSVRVPGTDYAAVLGAFEAIGRTGSLSIQRNDNSGPGANGDDAPVILSLSLTDDDAPLQQTGMAVVTSDVDGQSQQIKKDAATTGVEVKASSFQRQPDGTEVAQLTFRMPMSQYPAFLERLKQLGKVESLSVSRNDRPDQTRTDDSAPAEISLQLHNQPDIVAENKGLGATLRKTFGEGISALLSSVQVIGVVLAFLAPWVVTLILLAWIGRRVYVWRKGR